MVAGQDVEPGDEDGTWKITRGVAKDRVVSTVDPESRHVRKSRSSYRDGFKAHISIEPATGLIVDQALTAGNAADGPAGVDLLERERGPVDVLADSAYGSGQTRQDLEDAGHTQTIKPLPIQPTTDHPDAFTIDDFEIDPDAGFVACPAGHERPITADGAARFGKRCDACPFRPRCTTAKNGRTIKVHPHHDQLARARRDETDPDWQDRYRTHRPMVERSIAWLVRKGHRRVRYRGVERNSIWLAHRAAAVNLTRLLNLGLTQTSVGWALQPAG